MVDLLCGDFGLPLFKLGFVRWVGANFVVGLGIAVCVWILGLFVCDCCSRAARCVGVLGFWLFGFGVVGWYLVENGLLWLFGWLLGYV